MKILVVEDKTENIEAAKIMLANHELTIISGYDQAHELLVNTVNVVIFITILEKKLPTGWKLSSITPSHDNRSIAFSLENTITGKESGWDFPKDVSDVIEEAKNASKISPYDVVLTDVMIPKGGNKCMSTEGMKLAEKQGEMPYGPVIALRAIQAKIKKVGILTSGSHHDDPFVFAFDGLRGFVAGDVKVVTSNYMDVYVDSKTFLPIEDQDSDSTWKKFKSGEVTSVKNWTKLLQKLEE